ncbi:unnamed protein product [Paramecium primaurelia]|uniref:Uncharacterized protein n=1 Tax=Paramecium primaurelia TaxID=5886 RepID=A0A8S1PIZ8_PARPR|nr:unnamed protein product [Paramecium primaurelia]
MRKSVQLEMSKPLKYPSNDVSVCWPSFQSCNFSSMPICNVAENNPHMSLSKFSDSESENNHAPKKLEKLCSYHTYSNEESLKSLLVQSEKFWYSKIISSNIINITLFILTFYLPYFYYENFIESDPLYFPVLLFLLILELYTQFIKLLGQFLKNKRFSVSLLNIAILLTYTLCLKANNIILFTILYFLLFQRNLKFIQKMLSLILYINYQQIIITKLIILILFQIHYFACIWGVELKKTNQEDLIYTECFYKSFLMFFLKIDQLENQNHYLIITHLITSIIILIFVFTIFQQCQLQMQKCDLALKTYRLFLKSNMLELKVKLILFHYSGLFLLIENQMNIKDDIKKKYLLEYIKMKLIRQELSHLNFLSQSALNQISVKGVLGQNLKQQNQQAEINGLYIIIAGNIDIEFMGMKLQIDNRKIINLCLIEMMNTQQQGRIRFEQVDMNDLLYFYINQNQFNDCLQKQQEKEKYQMIRDDVIFNNNTQELNIQCHFCNLFHPTFNCICFNVKKRFTNEKIYQERSPMFQRKNNNRIKAGIYQQITHQGTNNNAVFDISSDSFEAFSDYSSDKVSVSNLPIHFEQIGKQTSITQIHKDILQIDMISDKITDPIISSTLIKHLQVPEQQHKHHQGISQTGFQDFDSLLDIDKICEYQYYKANFNLNNVLMKLNQQKF